MSTINCPADRKLMLLVASVLLFASTNLFFWLRSEFPMEITSPTTLTWWAGLVLFLISFGVVWIMIRWLGESWADYGLVFSFTSWRKFMVLVIQTAAVVLATYIAMRHVFGPVAMKFVTQPPNHSELVGLPGNFMGLIVALTVVWITAAFIEEMIFRGFLLRNIELMFGSALTAKVLAVLATGCLFGLMHIHQGFSGVIMTGGAGIVMGALFYLFGRNLWPLILGHGVFNSYQLFKVYMLSPVTG